MSEDVRQFVRTEVGRIFHISPDAVAEDAELTSLPGFDSIRVYELVLCVEKQYGVMMPEEETMSVRTLGQFVELLDRIRESARA
jgi:acyl carrier protein